MAQIEIVKTILRELWSFLEPQLNLANAHMVDYFTKSAYKRLLPTDIQSEVEMVGYDDFINLIFRADNDQLNKIPNTKFFIESCNKFTLKNTPECVCLGVDEFFEKLNQWGCTEIDKFKLEIFMTPKKSHEVEIMSAISSSISKISKVSHLVDIGDGKGYLSSMLALRHQIPVLGVDSCNTNTEGAVKRAKKLSKVWNGVIKRPLRSYPSKDDIKGETSEHLYQQITKYVNENDDFLSLIGESFPNDKIERVGLVGLHTCGDLAANSLKIYKNCDYIKSICNIGCCYHLLTEDDGGFPLSQFLSDLNVKIGRSGRMIANQSVDRILTNKELPNHSIYYRALLQVVLEKVCPVLPTNNVGKFRRPCENFVDYTRKAFSRLNIEHLVVGDADLENFDRNYQIYVNELNVFYLIRCQLSPVIESLILLDRLCFLLENNFTNSFIVQLFNPVISPRCYGILSMKDV